MASWSETVGRYLAEGRTVSGGKEDDSGKLAKQQEQQNNAKASQRLSDARGYESSATGATKDWLTGKVGFDPAQLAAMIAQFQNQVSSQKSDVGANVRAALASRGGAPSDAPMGGDGARGLEGLEGMFATARSSGIANIKIQDLMQALQNKQFAVNLRAGLAGRAGNQALGWGQQANQNITQVHDAFRPGFMENLGNAFAKAIPGVAMGLATGGLSGILSGGSMLASGATSGAASVPGFFSSGGGR